MKIDNYYKSYMKIFLLKYKIYSIEVLSLKKFFYLAIKFLNCDIKIFLKTYF